MKLKDNGTVNFYFDKFGMLLDRHDHNLHGQGDSLWRTLIAIVAAIGNKDAQLVALQGVKDCLEVNNRGKYRFARHPLRLGMDSSRDQNIMGAIAFKLYLPLEWYEISKNLSFWINDDGHGWMDAWFWAKGKYRLWRIVSCYHFIGWWFEPSYSLHLFCWMLWASKQKAPLIRWYLRKFIIPKKNYLCRALVGVQEDIPWHELEPMADFQWQRDYPWNDAKNQKLSEKAAEYNNLDIEVLRAVVEMYKNN